MITKTWLCTTNIVCVLSWDNFYLNEIANHTQDATDEGTIWFDDSAAEEKIIEYLENRILGSGILGYQISRENCSFLDLGTGNGHFLFNLRMDSQELLPKKKVWNGRMLGVDFSEKSIELARRIGSEKNGKEIEFKCWDIMSGDPSGIVLEGDNLNGWDIVVDKGTFDAISLSPEEGPGGCKISESYRIKVMPLIRIGGILIITSCNWTEEELKLWFCGPGLTFLDGIQYKRFCFGGQTGQTVSSVCFQRHAEQ